MEMLNAFFETYWLAAVLILCLAALLIAAVVDFVRRSESEKVSIVQEWLVWAVARAESYLGSGRGEQKLAMVYCWFEVRFPLLCKMITFDRFRVMVDEALDQLETFLIDDAIMDMCLGKVAKDE